MSKVMKKKIKLIKLFLISSLLMSCANQVLVVNDDVIVLGVVRKSFNIHDEYTIYTNGTGEVNLRLPAVLGSDPEWSPDGNWIISSTRHQGIRPKDSEIYLMRSDGSQRKAVAHHKGGSFFPTWSPDSKKIAYSARDDQNGIYILDISCFQQNNQHCNSSPTFLTLGDYASPAWSPDGNQIAYEKDGNIYVIDANGKIQPENLTPDMRNCRNPKWSPDGTKIIFSCYLPDRFDVFIVRMDDLTLVNLTNGIGSNTQPQWSPDGSKIAFISTRDGLGQIIGMEDTVRSNAIFLMNDDGNTVIRLSLRDDENILWFTWLSK